MFFPLKLYAPNTLLLLKIYFGQVRNSGRILSNKHNTGKKPFRCNSLKLLCIVMRQALGRQFFHNHERMLLDSSFLHKYKARLWATAFCVFTSACSWAIVFHNHGHTLLDSSFFHKHKARFWADNFFAYP